jgi:hypothetical protein
MLIKAAQFYFSIFNIHCPNLSVLEQLKTLLKNWLPSRAPVIRKSVLSGNKIDFKNSVLSGIICFQTPFYPELALFFCSYFQKG